jgi:hypothetical protein
MLRSVDARYISREPPLLSKGARGGARKSGSEDADADLHDGACWDRAEECCKPHKKLLGPGQLGIRKKKEET